MAFSLEEISQITIYLKKSDSAEKVNEVALFQPLAKKARFNSDTHALQARKFSFLEALPFQKKVVLRIQSFFFHHFPKTIPEERKKPEAVVKTVVAILLAQESLREFFLSERSQRQNFFESIQKAAISYGYTNFSPPSIDASTKDICDQLTTLPNQLCSLLEDPEELNRQMAAITKKSRDELLFLILNNIERLPITSVVEVVRAEKLKKIEITTKYGKYRVRTIDYHSGQIDLLWDEKHLLTTLKPSYQELGLMNQHLIIDSASNQLLGGFSAELTSYYHVLEQILFLLQERGNFFLEEPVNNHSYKEKVVLFTSLFSWNEYEKICEQHAAIEKLQGKILRVENSSGGTSYKLKLLHLNISFNAFNKFPVPAEIEAALNDLNTKCYLRLSAMVFQKANIAFSALEALAFSMENEPEWSDFFKKEQFLLDLVDGFNKIKGEILEKIEHEDSILCIALKALLRKKRADNKTLHGVDALIYSSLISRYLGVISNKNSAYATDRCASAVSLDKAQNAFLHLLATPFLPGLSSPEEEELFKVFYSMYLVFEEPELNSGLTTGFIGEKFYNNFIQRNPETTHYLISWLKEHPEVYLGLSGYR